MSYARIRRQGWRVSASMGALIAVLAAGQALAQPAGEDSPIANPGQAAVVPPKPSTMEEKIAALEARIAELQDAIVDLKVQSSAGVRDVRAQVAAAPTVTLANGRPSFATADGRFSASFRGVMQLDSALYNQDTPGPLTADFRRGAGAGDTAHARDLSSGAHFRRGRIGLEGKLFTDFDYNILLEFGGAGVEDPARLYELWLQYSGFKPFRFKIGAFIPNQGLEDSISTNGMTQLERPAPSDTTRTLAGADSRISAQLMANGDRWFASTAVTGARVSNLTGSGSGPAQSFDEQLSVVGRLAGTPMKGQDWLVHVGVNGSKVLRVADSAGPDAPVAGPRYTVQFRERPELRVDGTRLIDTGAIEAESAYTGGAEFAAQRKNFFVQGEYWKFGIERRNSTLSDPKFSGWYVEGSWILTGEPRRYNVTTATFDPPQIANPFSPKDHTWGALELAFRYSDTDLNYNVGAPGTATPADGVRGGDMDIWTIGANWYLNNAIRFMLHFQNVDVNRLSPNPTTFQTPLGAQVGQKYQVVSLRSQFAF